MGPKQDRRTCKGVMLSPGRMPPLSARTVQLPTTTVLRWRSPRKRLARPKSKSRALAGSGGVRRHLATEACTSPSRLRIGARRSSRTGWTVAGDAVHRGTRRFGRWPMARGRARAAGTDARVIEIDTGRVLARKQRHFAVIDVGSNSIRLVVYDDLSRAPFPRFNEKSFVALGAGLDASGRLSGRRSTWRCARCGGSSRSPGRCRSRPCTCWRPRPPAARPTAAISSRRSGRRPGSSRGC